MYYCDECQQPLTSPVLGVCPDCLLKSVGSADSSPKSGAKWLEEMLSRLRDRPLLESRYQVGQRIETGGQGEIFPVRDTWLHRDLAMKRIAGGVSTSPALLRFIQEAQILSQLSSPGIMPVFDVGLDADGCIFYTMPLVREQRTLADKIQEMHESRSGAWSLASAINAIGSATETIGYAHSRGVIHRDLKPTNILVGDFDSVFVIDWGSAAVMRPHGKYVPHSGPESPLDAAAEPIASARIDHFADRQDSPLLTGRAGFPGSSGFIPPEAHRGSADALGPQMDVYALGVILYILLTNRMPYSDVVKSWNVQEIRKAVLAGPPTPVARHYAISPPKLSPELEAICEKAMAYDRRERYESVRAMSEDLHAWQEVRVVRALGGNWLDVLRKWALRNRSLAVSLLVTFVAGIALMAAWASKVAADRRESVAIAAAASSRAKELEAQRDRVAAEAEERRSRQLAALRDADLKRRSGDWAGSLRQIEMADQLGYPDALDLTLRRLEIGYATANDLLVQEQIQRLDESDWPPSRRSAVLLKLGEYALFSERSFADGLRLVNEALDLGLPPGDKAFALGLTADHTIEALEHFHRALDLNPLNSNAHRHAFGLELFLGRREAMASHLEVFRVLFPDDPTADLMNASALLVDDQSEKAVALLQTLEGRLDAARLHSITRAFAIAATLLDILKLEPNQSPVDPVEVVGTWMRELVPMLASSGSHSSEHSEFRIPSLPSVRNATRPIRLLFFDEAGRLKKTWQILAMVFSDRFSLGLYQAVDESLRFHPEATLFYVAAVFLERAPLPEGDKIGVRAAKIAELLGKACRAPAMIPAILPAIRWKAAELQYLRFKLSGDEDPAARDSCLEHLRHLVEIGQWPATRFGEIWTIVRDLNEPPLMERLLDRREQAAGISELTLQYRCEAAISANEWAKACLLLDAILEINPDNNWAAEQRPILIQQLQQFLVERQP